MGQTTSRDTVAWAATLHRKKVTKKEYTSADLEKLVSYLKSEGRKLKGHLRQLQQDPQGWQKEYGALAQIGKQQPATASLNKKNASKNRYLNIVAYDHSRVLLKPNKTNKKNDYINANWVDGYKRPKAYIAAQGPVPDSFGSFWQMIWEQAVQTIVMVTNEVEAGKLKCHRYWPEAGQKVKVADYLIEGLKETATPTYIAREFQLTDMASGQSTEVVQLQFILWPDHGVPNTSLEILSFRDEVYRRHNPKTPLLIHCSAGVGRTGTYIAIDTLVQQGEDSKANLSVKDVVTRMRMARNFMVQTLVQYGFVYLSVLDAIDRGLGQAKQAISLLEKHSADVMATELRDINQELAGMRDEAEALGMSEVNAEVEQLRQTTEDRETRVTVAERMAAFMTAVQEVGGGGAVAAGWSSHDTSKLKDQSDQTEFDRQYTNAEGQWRPDDYAVDTSLDPMQSRNAVLTSVREAMRLRGERYRQQVEEFERAKIAGLGARVKALNTSIAEAEQVTLGQGSKAAASTIEGAASLSSRVASLSEFKVEGSNFGRVLPDKEEEAAPSASAEPAADTPTAAASAPPKTADADLYDDLFDNVWQNSADVVPEIDPEVQKQSFIQLRKAPSKEKAEHPMIAAAKAKAAKAHPMHKR
eukprot:m.95838 g.95838  ORF g.95838 m.95838 type:complete len:641 (+) comp15032_c0_seq1:203-2125(+)